MSEVPENTAWADEITDEGTTDASDDDVPMVTDERRDDQGFARGRDRQKGEKAKKRRGRGKKGPAAPADAAPSAVKVSEGSGKRRKRKIRRSALTKEWMEKWKDADKSAIIEKIREWRKIRNTNFKESHQIYMKYPAWPGMNLYNAIKEGITDILDERKEFLEKKYGELDGEPTESDMKKIKKQWKSKVSRIDEFNLKQLYTDIWEMSDKKWKIVKSLAAPKKIYSYVRGRTNVEFEEDRKILTWLKKAGAVVMHVALEKIQAMRLNTKDVQEFVTKRREGEAAKANINVAYYILKERGRKRKHAGKPAEITETESEEEAVQDDGFMRRRNRANYVPNDGNTGGA